MWRKVLIFGGLCIAKALYVNGHCVDIHSQIVSQGLHYVPGPNSCTLCICDKGGPKWCKSVLCSQPQNCKSFQRGNSCCEFKCLDDILTANETYKDTYDLALRLIASAVFVILTLSLLFFVVHRFRRHKLRVRQNRQLNEDQRSLNSIGYITGNLGYLPGNIGYLGSSPNDLEFHYEESNAHFALWKPPGNYFPRGEAPPPYEEAIRSAQIENNIINGTHPTILSSHIVEDTNIQHTRSTQSTPNPVQCRHQHLTRANTNQVISVNSETVTVQHHQQQHPEQIAVANLEKSSHPSISNAHSDMRNGRNNTPVRDKVIKTCASAEKSKSYENIVNRKNDRSVVNANLERKTVKPKSQMFSDQERSNTDKNIKSQKYDNVVVRNNSTQKDSHFHRKTDKSQIEANNINEVHYENINPCREIIRHKTIPHFSEYQNKCTPYMKESKSKDSVFMLTETNIGRDLDRTRFGERSESNLKNLTTLKDNKDMPLHRTLPKNLKELAVSVNSNGEYLSSDIFKRFDNDSFIHRSLPKQINNHDTLLSVNLVKSQINLSENGTTKDSSPCKSSNIETASSVRISLLETKPEDRGKYGEDERTFISYQCLSSSQDEDDYRSECENCKSMEIIAIEDEESDVFNETMTLQRRPEISEEVPYYRTSLTLPTQIRKPRAVTTNPGRNGWFMAMQETSSSEESE